MVYFYIEGEALALQPLDQVELPQRPVPIQCRAVQARHHNPQFALTAGLRQGRVLEVVIQFHVARCHQARYQGGHAVAGQAHIPGGLAHFETAHPLGQLAQVVRRGVAWLAKNSQYPDVHRRVRRFQQQPGRILRFEY